MASGIYAIRGPNNRTYIGSAIDIEQRWRDHRKELRGNRHHCIFLQRAWNRYGEPAFTFSVLEVVDDSRQLIEREQHWIDTTTRLYNTCRTAGSILGVIRPANVRANISKGRKGVTPIKSAEHLAKIAAALKGRRPADVTIEASAAVRRGKPLTEEHRKRVGEALRGKKRPPRSPEHIAKLRAAAQARMADPERRKHLSETLKARGIVPSMEARRKGAAARRNPTATITLS